VGDLGGLGWETDVLPVLSAAYAISGDSDPRQGISADDVSERLRRGANDPQTGRILLSLVDTAWIIPVIGNVSGRVGPISFRLSEKALQEVAGWPKTGSGDRFVEQLLAVLDERIAGAQGDEKSRLERLRGFIVGIGHDAFVAVVADAARRVGGEIV
jgi:hypothetical protein